MKGWAAQRGSRYADHDGFETALRGLGLDMWLWDQQTHSLEETLCGADRTVLDEYFPARVNGLRLLLTERGHGLPALRVAFRVDADGDGDIEYVSVGLRSTPEP